MKLIEQSHEILKFDDPKLIEVAGRTCYKSEDKITENSYEKFIKGLIKRQHGAMLEHASATVRFITDRAVTHELVRHRKSSFGQESQRYICYDDDMVFIKPVQCDSDIIGGYETRKCISDKITNQAESIFVHHCFDTQEDYLKLIELGWKPQQARRVLSNAAKTEIVVTCNFRQWRLIFELRALGTTGKPDPQMQALMLPLLAEFAERAPSAFGDLQDNYLKNKKG